MQYDFLFQQFAIKTLSKGLKKAHEMGKAEAKILFLTLVYILISSLSLVTITHAVVMREREIQIISDYFWCQSTGVHQGKQCDEGIQSTPLDTLLEVAIILEGLIPLCALIFVAKCTCNYNCLSTSWIMNNRQQFNMSIPQYIVEFCCMYTCIPAVWHAYDCILYN